MSDVVDWIRGRDAFHLVAMVGSIGSAAGRLREPLLRGRVEARALDGTLELRHGHGKKEVQDWDVPKEAWKGGPNNSAFQLVEAQYSSADYGTGYSRIKLSGLTFNRQQIIDYFGIDGGRVAATAESATKAKGAGGRKAAKGWPAFSAALAEWVVVNNDDAATIIGYGPDVILDAVLKLAQARTAEELPRSTYQPAVQEFVQVLKDSEARPK